MGDTNNTKTSKFTMRNVAIFCVVVLAVVLVVLAVRLNHNRSSAGTQTQTPKKVYVALGDSVAAGLGLATDSDSSACDRTEQAYSHQVATKLDLNLTNIACSGASVPQGITGPQTVNQLTVTPQLQQMFTGPKPSVVSLTVGANDVGWSTFIASCYAASCGTAAVNTSLQSLNDNLKQVLGQIQTQYKTAPPKVFVTGYNQVFPAQLVPGCVNLIGISAAELSWMNDQLSKLNQTIQSVVSGYSFVRYVTVNFSDHELCSQNPWVQDLTSKAPFHPNEQGQQQYAQAIINSAESKE